MISLIYQTFAPRVPEEDSDSCRACDAGSHQFFWNYPPCLP